MTVGIHARVPLGGRFLLQDFTDSRVAGFITCHVMFVSSRT